ncbi:MAG TPA: hypothetical protein VFR39_09205 [Burkholderiales bacterium]|nr:hypothetical protein [Burkholderiales bacterium]
MADLDSVAGESGDLFGEKPAPRREPATRRRLAPEMKVARALCRQILRKQASPEKKRIAHLICLNLVSMLKNGSQRPLSINAVRNQ